MASNEERYSKWSRLSKRKRNGMLEYMQDDPLQQEHTDLVLCTKDKCLLAYATESNCNRNCTFNYKWQTFNS